MCGIGGYYLSDGNKPWGIERIQVSLAHRGPDDSGVYEDKDMGVALAHARLSILDISSLGHQPMLSPEMGVVLVFNGEIYLGSNEPIC